MSEIIVNGERRLLPEGQTLSELLANIGLHPDGVAVAVNSHVVPRSDHPTFVLEAASKIEIIRAVGGG